MESRERCGRCRAKSIVRKSDDPREYCRAEHTSEKRTSFSPGRRTPECLKFHRTSEEDERKNEIASCVDKFALAKRLHAENLQHQPLPDRVDDSIFSKGCRICSPSYERDARWNRDRANPTTTKVENRFGPALGCKKPETRMDLAICWETPIDSVYEPHRATHIDGSEGGMAPAIFAMIQHAPVPKNRELLSRSEKDKCDCAKRDQREEKDSRRIHQYCCDRSCNELHGERRCEKSSRSNSVPRITERKCAACREIETEFERRKRDPRLIRSAVGVALGLEKKPWPTSDDTARRNGLPPVRMTVPRPRTPFARRAFCIDTLAPPFSVVNGCRDADYPEHWRLMSVYQQSYRNPQKRKARRF